MLAWNTPSVVQLWKCICIFVKKCLERIKICSRLTHLCRKLRLVSVLFLCSAYYSEVLDTGFGRSVVWWSSQASGTPSIQSVLFFFLSKRETSLEFYLGNQSRNLQHRNPICNHMLKETIIQIIKETVPLIVTVT